MSHTVLFGDETSFALAVAACRKAQQRDTHCIFEVDDAVAAEAVINRLGLRSTSVIEHVPAGGHYEAISKRLAGFVMDGADFILTGQASAIRYLHHALKRGGVPASRLHVRAYWAQGKAGLD